MGANSAIEWTTHTFNPWIGCMKVSAGCANCYAETLDRRWGHINWGPAKTTERRRTSASYWRQPIAWNKAAAGAEQRPRVFCASMADVFEDHPQVAPWRAELFDLISETPNLDWLLLTKRPENVKPMRMKAACPPAMPQNVWIGTSLEDQAAADERIPHLLSIPARVRFLSCEPLLGPIDIGAAYPEMGPMTSFGFTDGFGYEALLHWVIVGGESGPGARPMHPDWARSLRDQCQTAGVAYFMKQWGEYAPLNNAPALTIQDHEIRDDARSAMVRLGKHKAGRLLDGRTWDEVPA